jgi:hypothetical protein
MLHQENFAWPSITPAHCYRVFRLDTKDRVDQAVTIHSDDDEDAIITARGMVSGRSLELWDRGRFVGRFDPEREPGGD